MGYFMTAVQNDPIKVMRRVYAPAGNVPALLADVELTNTCQEEVKLFYYEYWDINIEQQVFQAFRSGILGSIGDSDRRILNRNFKPCMRWDESANALRFHLHPPEDSPSPSIPDEVCWLPPDVFLADLSGTPDRKYVDKRHFFGKGGAEKPDAIGKGDNDGIPHVNDTIMPYCMVLRREVRLEAGKSARLRFAYGTLDPDFIVERLPTGEERVAPAPMPPDWKQQFQQRYHLDDAVTDSFQDMLEAWKQRLVYFTIGSEPHLQREMAWHAYYLQSSTTYSQFFRSRIVPQGSVYLYGHGIDGVPRDHSLFTLPLTYLNPHLSRDMLGVIMQMTSGIGGQIAYSYKGNGALTDALVHKTPSDIDLFFLLAMTEYLAATGDMGFLNAQVPFYPGRNHPQDRTVLNHIRVAWDHLIYEVGVGDNNLIRVLDGDWSDDVVLKNVFPAGILTSPLSLLTSPGQTVEKGESVLNSQMALVILPGIAKLLASQPPSAAQDLGRIMLARLETLMPQLEEGIKAQWQEKGRFYARAILRYWWGCERVLHKNQLDLEGQVWAMIGQLEPERLQTLAHSVFEQCDKRSPIGALLASNQVWPAISQLLTWGYTRCNPELAWRSFVNQTFATKAEVYGDCWINIWTGPDGINGPGNSNPGGTYETAPVTPMTDFPAMNNNQHAMALLALLRVCGIEPSKSGDGLCITPRVLRQYTLDLPLLRLELAPGHIRGVYHAHNAGTRCLYVQLREHPTTTQITVNGNREITTSDKEGFVTITLPPFQEGDHIPFEVAEVVRPAARDTSNLATV
jgi:Glycosyl hydrolase 36 superfamily, catalytic domain